MNKRRLKKVVLVVILVFATNVKSYCFFDAIIDQIEEWKDNVLTSIEGVGILATSKSVYKLIDGIDQLACLTPQLDYYFDIMVEKEGCLINLYYISVSTNIDQLADDLQNLTEAIKELGETEQKQTIKQSPIEVINEAIEHLHEAIESANAFIEMGKSYEKTYIFEAQMQYYKEPPGRINLFKY
jgi:hypothetical protein